MKETVQSCCLAEVPVVNKTESDRQTFMCFAWFPECTVVFKLK